MTILEAVENRHTTWVEFVTPWPACGPEGNDLTSYCINRMTVHDAINAGRASAKQRGLSTNGWDRLYLEDFLAAHWASLKQQR
jgi:hypothetical protein